MLEASKQPNEHYKTGVHKDIQNELELSMAAIKTVLHEYIRYGRTKTEN